MEPGTYPGVPMADYLAIRAASNSTLARLIQSPMHAWDDMMNPTPPTPDLLMGQAIHTAALEPDTFAERYDVAGQCAAMKRGGLPCENAGKWRIGGDWFCGVRGHAPDDPHDPLALVLKDDEYDNVMRAAESIRNHPRVRDLLLIPGDTEVVRVWEQEIDGGSVLCKARADRWTPEVRVITDIKSTGDASPEGFEWSIWKFGYHRQAALYVRGFEATEFVFIAVEKRRPWGCAVYRMTGPSIDMGWMEVEPLLKQWRQCMESGKWPGYPEKIVDISLPERVWRASERRADLVGSRMEAA